MQFSHPQVSHPESIQDTGPPFFPPCGSSPEHPPLPLAASLPIPGSLRRDVSGMISHLSGFMISHLWGFREAGWRCLGARWGWEVVALGSWVPPAHGHTQSLVSHKENAAPARRATEPGMAPRFPLCFRIVFYFLKKHINPFIMLPSTCFGG